MKKIYLNVLAGLFLVPYFISAQAILQTDSMAVPRTLHEVQALPNGKVLVMGGLNDKGGPFHQERSCEIYDPATGLWSMTDSLLNARTKFTSVVTTGGKVLAIGGETSPGGQVLNVESYDPATGTWSVVGALPTVVSNCDAIVTSTGEILLDKYTKYYRGSADGSTWVDETPPNHVSSGESLQLIQMNNGKILSVGNQPGGNDFGVEYTGFTAQTTPFMVNDDTGSLLALLPNGKVLVAGPTIGSYNCELYDPATRSFSQTGVNSRGIMSDLMPMSDGRVAAMTWHDAFAAPGADTKILEIYDPANAQWTAVGPHTFTNPVGARTVAMGNGKYLICGGIDDGMFLNSGSRATFIFDENASPGVSLKENALVDLRLVRNGFNQIKVEGSLESLRAVDKLEMYNMAGQLVGEPNVDPLNPVFEVPPVARGFYILRLADKAGQTLYRQKMNF